MMPVLFMKSRRILRRLYKTGDDNVLYVYGPVTYDNVLLLRYAKGIGFKLVFDIVEDYDLALHISGGLKHRIRIRFIQYANRVMKNLANGLIVISLHLQRKYSGEGTPLHLLPISVDISQYPEAPARFSDPVVMFYAGSFGQKDGVPVLLDAFEKLATKNDRITLVLTGKGTEEMITKFHERLNVMPYRDRVVYKGYLDDGDYYAELGRADILCVPRIDSGYANAGFPFKLGEYLATGKPVIASAVSDISSLLADKDEVMLVPAGDSEAIEKAVTDLLSDPVQAFRLGSNGRKVAARLFDYKSQGDNVYQFIRGILLHTSQEPLCHPKP
jgi:glycosyltransferase involved in cell wall biosynthesis